MWGAARGCFIDEVVAKDSRFILRAVFVEMVTPGMVRGVITVMKGVGILIADLAATDPTTDSVITDHRRIP